MSWILKRLTMYLHAGNIFRRCGAWWTSVHLLRKSGPVLSFSSHPILSVIRWSTRRRYWSSAPKKKIPCELSEWATESQFGYRKLLHYKGFPGMSTPVFTVSVALQLKIKGRDCSTINGHNESLSIRTLMKDAREALVRWADTYILYNNQIYLTGSNPLSSTVCRADDYTAALCFSWLSTTWNHHRNAMMPSTVLHFWQRW